MRRLRWSRGPSGPECRVWPDSDRGTFWKSLLGSTVSTGKPRGQLICPPLKQEMKPPVISPALLDQSPSSPATKNTETERRWPAMSNTEHLLLYLQPAMMHRPHVTPGSQWYNKNALFLLVNSRNSSLGLLWKSASCTHACSVMSDSATSWTVAHQAPLSMGFSRQEYWSGLSLPSLGGGSSQPSDRTLDVFGFSCIGRRILDHWATWEAPKFSLECFLKVLNESWEHRHAYFEEMQ